MGVRNDIVNFEFPNQQTGKCCGLEIDIAAEMAHRMGYADIACVTVTPGDRKEKLLADEPLAAHLARLGREIGRAARARRAEGASGHFCHRGVSGGGVQRQRVRTAGILPIAVPFGAKGLVSDILPGLFIILEGELPNTQRRLPAIEDGPFCKGAVSLAENGVTVHVAVQCAGSSRGQLERDLRREMKPIFDEHDIQIPYARIVVHQPGEHQKATVSQQLRADRFNEGQKVAARDLGNENRARPGR